MRDMKAYLQAARFRVSWGIRLRTIEFVGLGGLCGKDDSSPRDLILYRVSSAFY